MSLFKFVRLDHEGWAEADPFHGWQVYSSQTKKYLGTLEEIDPKYTTDFTKNNQPTFIFRKFLYRSAFADDCNEDMYLYGATKEEAMVDIFYEML
jgi:hypothetical protein